MAVKFLDTFSDTQYPIVSHLCDYLLIGDIVALTRTCRSLSTLYRNLLPAQWNVNRDLRQFVHDPNGLRSAMAKNDAVIAGSFALQFFERSTWRAADLDLYVQQGHQFESLTRYFMDTEGYHPSARVESTDEYGTGAAIVTVASFEKLVEDADDTLSRVQVIATSDIPIKTILEKYHSTVVVNFITWSKAYSIYPIPTFIHRRGFLFKLEDQHIEPSVSKYRNRGWNIQPVLFSRYRHPSLPIPGYRRIGDRYTWRIPLDISQVEQSQTPDYVIEHGTFQIIRHQSYCQVSAPFFTSHALRYKYTAHDYCSRFLRQEINPLVGQELYSLTLKDKPTIYEHIVDEIIARGHYDEDFVKPDAWNYWDHLIPGLYEQWELQQQTAKEVAEGKLTTSLDKEESVFPAR